MVQAKKAYKFKSREAPLLDQVRNHESSQRINLAFDMNRITLEPGKRGGRPCIRGLRITVYDVLSMLPCGMSQQEIQDDFPELTSEDISAVLAYAADREPR